MREGVGVGGLPRRSGGQFEDTPPDAGRPGLVARRRRAASPGVGGGGDAGGQCSRFKKLAERGRTLVAGYGPLQTIDSLQHGAYIAPVALSTTKGTIKDNVMEI